MQTSNELINKNFGASLLRLVVVDDEPLFVAKDVCEALGYKNPRQAVATHCKGVQKRDTPTSGGIQEVAFIPESDVYRLVMQSKLPSAEKFKDWVCEEVLPEIRKNGTYEKGEKQEMVITPTGDPILDMLRVMTTQREELISIGDRLSAIESGSIPQGWNTIGELSRRSGLSKEKTRLLISAYQVASKKIPQSGDNRVTYVTVCDEDDFFNHLNTVKSEMSVSNNASYFNHPSLGRFTMKQLK